jgi:hypothetical protein
VVEPCHRIIGSAQDHVRSLAPARATIVCTVALAMIASGSSSGNRCVRSSDAATSTVMLLVVLAAPGMAEPCDGADSVRLRCG